MNNYQWYPGHMAKALRIMKEDIKLVDVLLELCDARAPESTRNPNIGELAKNKIHILLLNKVDLADENVTRAWLSYYKERGINAISLSSKERKNVEKINAEIDRLVKNIDSGLSKKTHDILKKMGADMSLFNTTTKIMVSGIPNVGKSTFINSFTKKASTKTGNRPGVTRGRQWISIAKGKDLLDTPGVLYVKPTSVKSGMNLAFIGSLNDNNLNLEELALDLLKFMNEYYFGVVENYYEIEHGSELELYENIAKKRQLIKRGGVIDYERCATLILNDFRNANWGGISLEEPDE